jgi:alanine dehydrogenase
MIRVLGSRDVAAVLTMAECIEVIDVAMRQYSQGSVAMPVRLTTNVPDRGDHLSMPAALPGVPALGMKCITIYPGNPGRGAPILQGLMVVNDFDTGTPLAVMDAGRLTAMRTAAASAVATRALARADASRVAIIGTGVQGASHLEAMCLVRPISEIAVASRTRAGADRFVAEQQPRFPDRHLVAVDDAREAIEGADLICAVSSARTPVMARAWLKNGVHINGVGSHGAEVREVDGITMRDARVAVDSRESALRECGDCLLAIEEGLFSAEHVSDEIGSILLGLKPGRTSDDEITVYQSCGLAVQDVAVARLAYDRAVAADRGALVDLA